MENLNISLETLRFIKESIDTKLMDLGLRGNFVNLASKARPVKTKISKCNYIKLKILWHSRRNHQQHKKATNQMEEDICKQGL